MKNPDPLMGAKLKSKTHLLIFEAFIARLASNFYKRANFLEQIRKRSKTQNFMLISTPLNQVVKIVVP
jgi:hypothetical protein